MEPICLLNEKVTMLWNRFIKQVNAQWSHLGIDEVIWDLEAEMKETYPFLFLKIYIEDGVI